MKQQLITGRGVEGASRSLYNHSVQVAAGLCAEKEKGPCKARAFSVSGGARRDRTADLYNAIVALSQLSYGPRRLALCGERGAFSHARQNLSTSDLDSHA